MIVPSYGAHRTPGGAHPKSAPKTLPMFGSNASNEPDQNYVQCPHRSVGEHASDDGSNALNGRKMTRAGADDVASDTEGTTVSKGWHGAKHFGAKKKFCAVRGSNMWCFGAEEVLWRARGDARSYSPRPTSGPQK